MVNALKEREAEHGKKINIYIPISAAAFFFLLISVEVGNGSSFHVEQQRCNFRYSYIDTCCLGSALNAVRERKSCSSFRRCFGHVCMIR